MYIIYFNVNVSLTTFTTVSLEFLCLSLKNNQYPIIFPTITAIIIPKLYVIRTNISIYEKITIEVYKAVRNILIFREISIFCCAPLIVRIELLHDEKIYTYSDFLTNRILL